MTQVGEAISPYVLVDERHDSDCYFCNAKADPAVEENDLVANPEEDEDLDGGSEEPLKFKNDSGKLGTALGGAPDPQSVDVWGTTKPVSVAAHHLIPGNAALKKSQLFQSNEYLWKDGSAKGNIGYNVNSLPNGIWLPGNYAVRPWSSKAESKKKEYAFAAIRTWGRQFHDAHEQYSTKVLEALDKLYDKLEDGESVWCPEASKKEKPKPEERQNLYAIVSRLNTTSGRLARMLRAPISAWKKNIYTSRFSQQYMDEA
ncbi:MAG TPA: AHH domain-containing protein [Gemmatimonadaceae bacterium]|nr:AHH domain-containing protein [Gemmatimonadaceae bacterium]